MWQDSACMTLTSGSERMSKSWMPNNVSECLFLHLEMDYKFYFFALKVDQFTDYVSHRLIFE